MKPFPPPSSRCLADNTRRSSLPLQPFPFAVRPQTAVAGLWSHTGPSSLGSPAVCRAPSARARSFNPLRFGGRAAAPANVHVVLLNYGAERTAAHHCGQPHTHAQRRTARARAIAAFQSALLRDNQEDYFHFNPLFYSHAAVTVWDCTAGI